MKQWFIPLVALALFTSTFSAPAEAWPFGGKKDKDEANATAPKEERRSKKDRKTADYTQSSQQSTISAPDVSSSTSTASSSANEGASQNSDSLAIPKVQVKSPLSDEVNGLKVEDPVESPELPLDKTFVTIDDPNNPLGVTTSAQKLNDSAQLISNKRYKEAHNILAPLKDWLVDATEAHITLHKTLKNIPSAQVQAELEKQLALQFALLRDKAFFQLGMLAIGQEDYSNAIKNLSRVIQSQPRSAMGAQAYEVLQKIGFTEKIQLRETKKVSQTTTP